MADELITISRAGTEIGKFLAPDLLMMIEQKKVLLTDHYWREGMADWGTISQFIALRTEAGPNTGSGRTFGLLNRNSPK
jgi:hypothetical protein